MSRSFRWLKGLESRAAVGASIGAVSAEAVVSAAAAVVAAVAAVAGLGTSCGCQSSRTELPLVFELVVAPPAGAQSCPASGRRSLTEAGLEMDRVRLTFYRADEARSEESFVCDRVMSASESNRSFYVPGQERHLVDVTVEGYTVLGSGELELEAVGTLSGVDLEGSGSVDMAMWRVGRSQCGMEGMAEGRAFASVSALPGGRALIVGGALASPQGSVDTLVDLSVGLYLSSSVEVFDFESGEVSLLEPEGAPVARAFHRAFLLPGSDASEGRLLLVGGVAGRGSEQGDTPLAFRSAGETFRVVVGEGARPAKAQVLSYDLAAGTVSWDATVAGLSTAHFEAVAQSSGMLVTAGGAEPDEGGGWVPLVRAGAWDIASLSPAGAGGELSTPRMGATASRLGEYEFLVWGGAAADATSTEVAAEALVWDTISGSTSSLSASALAYSAMLSNTAYPGGTVFHTATRLPTGESFVFGGFELVSTDFGDQAVEPLESGYAFRVVVDVEAGLFGLVAEPAAEQVLSSVGYHAATLLPGGSVLVTGGSPSSAKGGEACDTAAPYFCSLAQAAVVHPGEGAVEGTATALPGGLREARFGHAQAHVTGRGVVVAGGLRRSGGKLHTVRSLEIYPPSSLADPAADPLDRPPGEISSLESECPDSDDL